MVNRTFWKTCVRSVRSSFSRFFAIFAIVALGCGFLAGLLVTTPDMRHSASRYYHDTNLYDLRIIGSLGLEEGDAAAVAAVAGVEAVMPAHMTDREIVFASGDTFVARLHGVRRFGSAGSADMNRSLLVDGRWPQAENECVVEREYSLHDGVMGVGSTFTVLPQEEDEETLTCTEYTVVGVVTSGYYISMVQRGSTSVGNGTIGCIAYISDSCFDLDYYTDLYVTVSGAFDQEAYTQAYDDTVAPVQQALEDLSEAQKHIRADRLLQDAQDALSDARQELSDKTAEGQAELDDALRELQDGEQDYQDGLIDYESGRQELDDAGQALQEGEADLAHALKQLQEGEAEYQDGLQQYQDGKADYEAALQTWQDGQADYTSGLAEYEENKGKLDDAYVQLQDGKAQLKHAASLLEEGQAQLESGQAQLDAARAELAENQRQLDAGFASLEEQQARLDAAYAAGLLPEAQYQASLAQLRFTRQQLEQNQAQLNAGLQQLDASQQELDDGGRQLARSEKDYDAARQQLEQAEIDYRTGLLRLSEAETQLSDAAAQLADGKQQLDDAAAQLADSETQLQDARRELDDGWADYRKGLQTLQNSRADYQEGQRKLSDALAELTDARKTLDDGWADYESGKQEFEEKIADANQKLRDAEDEIAKIEDPEWYVLTRSESNEGYIYYESDTEKVQSIAKVFPVFFFLVAALVASTTMTRMIDEDRGSIGTLKALGYGPGAIALKYISYAMAASLLGSGFGLAIGLFLFPRVICNAYKLMYQMPGLIPADHTVYALISAVLILLAILAATLGALRSSLKSCAAELMRPKAPPAGKRILLERVGFLWKRMKFSHKVTARNLFRYKKRFFMTLIGITGCTALLLTGFGLRDSIRDIVDLQFGQLMEYNLTVQLKHEGDEVSDRRIAAILADESRIEDYLPVHSETGLGIREGVEVDLHIVVPSDDEALSDFVLFRDRKTHAPIAFSKDGAILSEKAAKRLGVKAGDTFTLQNQEEDQAKIRVAGVCENYVYGYAYLPHEVYEAAFGQPCAYDTLYVKAHTPDAAARDALASQLLSSSNATGVSFSDAVRESFSDMLRSIDSIVMVLIISAAALAFVVLYNLTNINICERQKELATIKVLGFHPKEVSAYVYRETVCLSLMGTVLGLFFGIFLHRFVVQTAEVDAVMFGREISPLSFLFSAVMTLLFTLLVNLAMARKLRRIDMVESLKAPE